LDLDATGKALIVDLAARAAAAAQPANAGVLVSIGGDIKVEGRPPRGGWRVQLDEDSAAPSRRDAPVAVIRDGALATSSTTAAPLAAQRPAAPSPARSTNGRAVRGPVADGNGRRGRLRHCQRRGDVRDRVGRRCPALAGRARDSGSPDRQ